jgi:hypothetical protein
MLRHPALALVSWLALLPLAQAAAPVAGPDGHLYRFVAGAYEWPEAAIIAPDMGWYDEDSGVDFVGQLATIGSEAENTFVAALTGGAAAWLGAASSDGLWTWRSGPEEGQALDYANWAALPTGSVSALGAVDEALVINALGPGLWSAAVPSGPQAPRIGFVVEYLPLTAPVPEPAPAALLALGLAALAWRRRRATPA